MESIKLNIMGKKIALVNEGGITDEQWTAIANKWSWLASSGSGKFTKLIMSVSEDNPAYPVNKDNEDQPRYLWSKDIETIESHLSSTLTLMGIEHNKGKRIMLHACGISDEEGQVVAFVAKSGTGKTTLARTLGAEIGYVTDETLVVDFEGNVTWYPKPLSVITDVGNPKMQVGPKELAFIKPPKKLKLKKITLLDRDKESADKSKALQIKDVPLADAIMALTPELSHMKSVDKPLHRLAELIERTGGVSEMKYVEASSVLHDIDKLFQV
ncbi:MAG: hypothetical protein QM571_01130 [Micrococcaceae bacterium]